MLTRISLRSISAYAGYPKNHLGPVPGGAHRTGDFYIVGGGEKNTHKRFPVSTNTAKSGTLISVGVYGLEVGQGGLKAS